MIVMFAGQPGDDIDFIVQLETVPRMGDTVTLPARGSYRVDDVDWYPLGDGEKERNPFAYVSLTDRA